MIQTSPDTHINKEESLYSSYVEAIWLTERLYRQFLDVLKNELDRLAIKDINNVQSAILFNIGADLLTVGELTARGYYMGSNVSYNLRKMVENGYLCQERSAYDRRSVHVRLTDKGQALWRSLIEMFNRHTKAWSQTDASRDLAHANNVLRRLERFWIGTIGYPSSALSVGELPVGNTLSDQDNHPSESYPTTTHYQ